MLLEALVAALVGIAGLWLVLQPLLAPGRRVPQPLEPLDPEETPRGIALAALKEIDFDRETGKLSEGDYRFLKSKYTAIALEALRGEDTSARPGATVPPQSGPIELVVCSTCGPRPEPDAIFCSRCGLRLVPRQAIDQMGNPGSARAAPPAAIPPKPLQAG
jgi:hypothetical protein